VGKLFAPTVGQKAGLIS